MVSEHLEQARFFAVIRRMALSAKRPELKGLELAFAIPNGFLDSKSKRIRAHREGVLSGVPDVFIPIPSKGFHGLFLEFKRQGGRVTKAQASFINSVAHRGYKAQVVFSCQEALYATMDYLDPKGQSTS